MTSLIKSREMPKGGIVKDKEGRLANGAPGKPRPSSWATGEPAVGVLYARYSESLKVALYELDLDPKKRKSETGNLDQHWYVMSFRQG